MYLGQLHFGELKPVHRAIPKPIASESSQNAGNNSVSQPAEDNNELPVEKSAENISVETETPSDDSSNSTAVHVESNTNTTQNKMNQSHGETDGHTSHVVTDQPHVGTLQGITGQSHVETSTSDNQEVAPEPPSVESTENSLPMNVATNNKTDLPGESVDTPLPNCLQQPDVPER